MTQPTTQQMVEATKRLDDAIVEFMRDINETPIVVDWYLVTEVHSDEDGRVIKVAESGSMTPWKRDGLVRFLARAFGIGH